MGDAAKKALSERDLCTKYITPTLVAGTKWDQSQIREEVSFTKGRVLVRGKKPSRGEVKRADYIWITAQAMIATTATPNCLPSASTAPATRKRWKLSL